MNVITINVGQGGCNAAPLLIGYAGEDSVDAVDFDFSAWAQDYGEGTISLELMRASDTAPYLAILTVDGTTARWTVSDVDTARSGPGVAQLIYKPARGTKKSAIYKFYVGRSLTEPGGDDPWGPIIERMEEILAEMQQQADAADQSAEDAEAWAVGERGGEPVPETDETHENNAKYYAEQAGETAREFLEVTAPAAVRAVNEAGQAQAQAITDAGAAAVQAVSAERAGALDAINTAGQTAVSAVDTAKTGAVQNVNTAKTDALAAIEQKSTTEQAAVEQKGEDALAALQEYADLPGEVDDLKSALNLQEDSVKNAQNEDLGTVWLSYKYGKYTTPGIGSTASFVEDNNYICAISPCVKGDIFYACAKSTDTYYRSWAVLDSNYNTLNRRNPGTAIFIGEKEITEDNAAFIIFNFDLAQAQTGFYAFKGKPTKEQLKYLKDALLNYTAINIEPITGDVFINSNNFNVGNITISTSGWVYGESQSRVATIEGFQYELEAGDRIFLSEPERAQMYIGGLKTDETYIRAGWITNYTVPYDGKYVILIRGIPEEIITDKSVLTNLLRIKRKNNDIDDISNRVDYASMPLKSAYIKDIDHGGADGYAQNTLESFVISKKRGYDAVELDVRFTSDVIPVLLHDTDIAAGVPIKTITYQEALTYNPNLATLNDALILCKNIGIEIALDLKVYSDETDRIVADMVFNNGMGAHVMFFVRSQTAALIKGWYPDAKLCTLTGSITQQLIDDLSALKTETNEVILGFNVNNVNEEMLGFIPALRNVGIKLYLYTINNEATYNTLKSIPYVTGAVSDYGLISTMLYNDAMLPYGS